MRWIKKQNIFNKHHAQLPVVDEYDLFYRLYYSTRIEGKSQPMFIDIDKSVLNQRHNKIKINVLSNGAQIDQVKTSFLAPSQ